MSLALPRNVRSTQEVNELKWEWSALLPEDWKKNWDRWKYILLVVLVGVILLLIPSGENGGATQQSDPMCAETFDLEKMERKLEHALSRIQGAGEVTVVLTLKEGSRQVPARDTQVSDSTQSSTTVVISQGSGNERIVTLQSVYPKYQGALVVCTGGGDARVKLELLEAMRALTGLSAERISICKCQ